MRANDVIFLIKKTVEYDELKNPIETLVERMVYANRYQVSASEFYSINQESRADVSDFRRKESFQVFTHDYELEDRFRYNDITYRILRVSPKGERTVIVGEEVLADGS